MAGLTVQLPGNELHSPDILVVMPRVAGDLRLAAPDRAELVLGEPLGEARIRFDRLAQVSGRCAQLAVAAARRDLLRCESHLCLRHVVEMGKPRWSYTTPVFS